MHKFALEQFAAELLPVIDSLDLGMASAAERPAGPEALLEGMKLTREKFRDVLGRFGIEEIEPRGEPFDPERHEAVNVREAADTPPNTVLDVFQKGYLLNGRLVRPARVIVSRAPVTQ
jgi:molecular chaperone GrpE